MQLKNLVLHSLCDGSLSNWNQLFMQGLDFVLIFVAIRVMLFHAFVCNSFSYGLFG